MLYAYFLLIIIYSIGDYMKIKHLIISIVISLSVGLVSSLLTLNNQNIYDFINVPFFAPPGWLFPVVWTILYIILGISSYLIYESNDYEKNSALKSYGVQLFLNFFWSIIFFNFKNFLLAFIWIILLLISIVIMIYKFYKINKSAGLLNIPYFLWALFASVLNFFIIILN